MTTTYIVIGIVVLAVIWAFLFGGKLPALYRIRDCQGKQWRNAFPTASKTEIRNFLIDFALSFAIAEKGRLKFNPEDKLLDIYRALNPNRLAGDALEFETLAKDIEEKYGVKFAEIYHENITLGELFSKTRQMLEL